MNISCAQDVGYMEQLMLVLIWGLFVLALWTFDTVELRFSAARSITSIWSQRRIPGRFHSPSAPHSRLGQETQCFAYVLTDKLVQCIYTTFVQGKRSLHSDVILSGLSPSNILFYFISFAIKINETV